VIAPFAFATLPAVARSDIEPARRVRALLRGTEAAEVAARALADLVGEPVTITLRRVRSRDPSLAARDAVAVRFAADDHAFVVDVEASLAAIVVARALKQRVPRIVDGFAEPVAGAFAAVLHAMFRRALSTPLRVEAVGPSTALVGELPDAVTASFTARVGPDAFDARVHGPRAALPPATARLGDLGALPIALPIVVATCLATRADLALRDGDVLLVPETRLRGTGALTGPVVLVAPRSERGLEATLAEDGRLVVRTERAASQPWSTMDSNATLEVLEDAPLVVRIELGVVEMTAREWAALGPGDVIPLGRKLGDPAVLRVGGVEVARGELVQVDGEYGVRILAGETP